MREWLLVIATGAGALAAIASAVAAYFSVVASVRQETATYESQLYNKQVDTIAALMQSAQDTARKIDDDYNHFLDIRPDGQDTDDKLIPLVDDTLQREANSVGVFITTLQSAWLIVPDDIKDTLSDLDKTMRDMLTKVSAAETPGNTDLTDRERQDMEKQVMDLVAKLGGCVSRQLASGRPLEGSQFKTCFEQRRREKESRLQPTPP